MRLLTPLSAAPTDYTAVNTSLVFTPLTADQPQCITTTITNDNVLEDNEIVVLQLSTEDTAVDLPLPSTTVSITDNDRESIWHS